MSAYDYTAAFGFTLIGYQSQTWQTEEYSNWRRLDAILAGIAELSIPFAAATGLVNAYAVAYTEPFTAYTTGMLISFKANLANTGAATVNVDGLGAKALFRDGAALDAGAIVANDYVKAIYDRTQFLVIDPKNTDVAIEDDSLSYTKLTVGRPQWDASGNTDIAGALDVDGQIRAEASLVFNHSDAAQTSANITYSTSDPSGGNNGDIWIKHAA